MTETKSSLAGLVIRTAVVRLPEVGYVIACDTAKEEEGIPHAVVARWTPQAVHLGDRNYDAHSLCLIELPELGLVDISSQGYFALTASSGMNVGEILDHTDGRVASFRAVSAIAGRAWAVGLRGMVYRFEGPERWARVDAGLPDDFDAQAVHGFHGEDVYAVGRNAAVWHYDGESWESRAVPSNRNLTAVHCAGDGNVYVAGHGGTLLRGDGGSWEPVDPEGTTADFWDLQWFDGRTFASTMRGVYEVFEDCVAGMDPGLDERSSFYQLSATDGVMWSVGEFDILSYDGEVWEVVLTTRQDERAAHVAGDA